MGLIIKHGNGKSSKEIVLNGKIIELMMDFPASHPLFACLVYNHNCLHNIKISRCVTKGVCQPTGLRVGLYGDEANISENVFDPFKVLCIFLNVIHYRPANIRLSRYLVFSIHPSLFFIAIHHPMFSM